MKKRILAVSVAAALGFAGAASAAPVLKANGIGHVNVIPYFSSQGNNVTHIHITNTDTQNGKAVKVRFRGAEWSDDLFDFTVFLSPGDVYVGTVASNADGVSTFKSYDTSCTLPASVNTGENTFGTWRLSDSRATGTREGYVEIINMADIPVATGGAGVDTLYEAIKHVDGVAPCTSSILNALVADNPTSGTTNAGMTAPSGTLSSWARILDVANIKAYGMNATAWAYSAATQKQYYRQSNDVLAATTAMTADMIFFDYDDTGVGAVASATPITRMYQFDMPDLSTPVDTTYANAFTHRDAVAAILRKEVVISDFATNPDVGGATDIVLNQPLRRYYYVYSASGAPNTAEGTDYSRKVDTAFADVKGEVASIYADLVAPSNRIVLANLGNAYKPSATYTGAYTFFNRNEQFVEGESGIVISPQPPTTIAEVAIAGEVSVISLNNNSATTTAALGASLTINDLDTDYRNGWMALSTISKTSAQALPVIGFTAMKVTGADNYGTTLNLGYSVGALNPTIGH